ncbi:MAG: potassium channel family protein [Muribaculaceae bacterium]|nr:potassium channel family protein [Muribaculaceae bacterium]
MTPTSKKSNGTTTSKGKSHPFLIKFEGWTITALHIVILLLSILLITLISIDTFNNISFYAQPRFQKWQYWICLVFLADFFIEFLLAEKKWHYFYTRFIFLLVSIPYQYLFLKYDIHISKELDYIIRFMPLIRGGYAMAYVVSWLTSNKATSLFLAYLISLFSTVYFASLTFYLFEKGVNPLVKNYTDAIWWAAMDVTTVGSNIIAVTGVGRVLSVVLAALGMMMFPIFTVYVTNLITNHHSDSSAIVPDSSSANGGSDSGQSTPKTDDNN